MIKDKNLSPKTSLPKTQQEKNQPMEVKSISQIPKENSLSFSYSNNSPLTILIIRLKELNLVKYFGPRTNESKQTKQP